MNMRNIMGGALLLAATSALCTTETANANCNSILVYDNGFPNICVVVASQVNNTTGADPAGADDFTVFAAGMRIDDIHWYTAEPTAAGIGWAGQARVTVYPSIAACGGPDKAGTGIITKNYGTGAADNGMVSRTVVNAGAVSVGGVGHDIVRYDITKININLTGTAGGTKYWLSLQPISTGPNAPGNSLWMSTRCEVNGDVLVGCGAWSDTDTSVAGGWSVVEVPAVGDEIDLNFQLTRCDTPSCPANLDQNGASQFQVDVFDLFILLGNWNTNGLGAALAAPTNIVDVFDLFILLAAIGQICPQSGTNDSCAFATLLVGPGATPYDTTGASSVGPADGAGCTPPIPAGQNDIWYCWKAECDGFTNITLSGAHAIRVYAGGTTNCGDCGALGAPVACSATGTVRFLAVQGNHYRFRVSGLNASGTMTVGDCEPFNDECEDAIVILTGDTIDGTLLGYNPDPGLPSCTAVDAGGTLGQAAGVWYVTIGDGTTYTATTCHSPGVGVPPGQADRIAVFCGTTCEGLQPNCVLLSGADQPCGLALPGTQANVSWCTVTGVIYFIYLTMDNNVDVPGPYRLALTSDQVPCNPTSFEAGCPGIPGDVCQIDEDNGTGDNCQLPDQMGSGIGGTLAGTSDRNPGFGFTIAEDFSVAASGSISSVCWWGIYNNFAGGTDCAPGDGSGNSDDFRINFYTHNALQGIPGGLIASRAIGALGLNTQKVYSGNDTGGIREEWEFTTPISPAVAVVAGTCYWIEISNNTLGACAWLWVTTPEGNGRSAQDTDGGAYAPTDCSDYDVAFCLNLDLGDTSAICGSGCACFEPLLCTLNGYYQCPNFGTAFTSDPDIDAGTNIVVADNFIVNGAGQSATSICFWGVFLAFAGGFAICNTEPPAGATFTVRFYTDTAGLPTLIPFATRTAVATTRVDTLVNIIDDVFEFSSAAFAPAVDLSAHDGNTIWVSVQLDPNQTCEFLITDSNVGDQKFARSTNGAAFVSAADDLAFRLNITATTPAPPPPPANDNCVDAIAISDGVTPFSTISATTDGPANASGVCNDFGSPQTHHDIWFLYTATCTGNLLVTTCVDLGGVANYDTDLVVYQAGSTCPVTDAMRIACNDDDPTNPCGTAAPFASTINVQVVSGLVYRIRVGGWGAGDNGTGSLNIVCTP